MKILSIPNETLRKKSQVITKTTQELLDFIQDMEHTLVHKKNPEGVGLSAPQVGKNLRIFSVYLDHDDPHSVSSFINPVISYSSKKMTIGSNPKKPFLEGCLSMPNLFAPVWRHQRIKLRYQIIDPKTGELVEQQSKFENFPARVVQHEMDHLDGILFTDRSREQGLPIYQEQHDQLVEIDPSGLTA